MEDPFSSDQYDITDFLNEDFAALGEDLQAFTPTAESDSSNNFINIPTSNSSNTLCALATELPSVVAEIPTTITATTTTKKRKSNSSTNQNVPNARRAARTPIVLTFGNTTAETNPNKHSLSPDINDDSLISTENLTSQGNLEEAVAAAKSTKLNKKTGGRVRPASQTYDHIIAERKRREQLSQHFVALSAIVPGLKKVLEHFL